MPYCPNCGTQNTDTAKFCINCGVVLPNGLPEQKPAVTRRLRWSSRLRPSRPFFARLGFWGSLMIIAGFFTSWINPAYGGRMTGLQIVMAANDVVKNNGADKIGLLILITVLVINFSALVCFLYVVGLPLRRGAFIFFKILPLLILITVIAYVIIKTRPGGVDIASDPLAAPGAFGDLIEWKAVGVGLFLTLVGSFLLAISGSRR